MKLAIKGHKTRGKEVIQLLEMLGGKNIFHIAGTKYGLVCYIDDKNNIFQMQINDYNPCSNYTIFTLEEFEEKFPYKIGDKVKAWVSNDNDISCGTYQIEPIVSMQWDETYDEVSYKIKGYDKKFYKERLQPYKEETMEEDKKVKGYCSEEPEDSGKTKKIAWFTFWDNDFADEVELYLKDRELVQKDGKWFVVKKNLSQLNLNELERKLDEALKEETMEENRDEPKAPILSNRYDYAEGKCGYVIPDGYEFDYIKEGFQTEIILKPKKPQYPKTYEECCEVLGISRHDVEIDLPHPYQQKMFNLFKLHICRDAYWKIAGDEMGLEKPWKPDWSISGDIKYVIEVYRNNVRINSQDYSNTILAFPTPEMRDAFYENFKDLIEQCKELL